MKPSVYLETTIVSYLTARPTHDPVMMGMIEQTKTWWAQERENFDLIVSDVVLREASSGDPEAAKRRMEILRNIAAVEADTEAQALVAVLLNNMALPANAADDATHIAVATVNEIDYLLTWNCRHIANATLRPKVEHLCLAEGYRCPIICTPHELRKPTHED